MNSISIGFTGDFCPINRIGDLHTKGNWKVLFNGVKPFFDTNDFNIIDLECPLTSGGKEIVKTGPHLRAIPAGAEILSYLNCKLVVTANNHFNDYGAMGMTDTYTSLKDNGIDWIGSGLNLAEASRIGYLEKNGIRIAIINMTENEWTTTHDETPGCAPIDHHRALLQIREARDSGARYVVVVLHGGHEHYHLPSPPNQSQFRFMVDAGADAVVGHHPHIISGYEVYREKPIFYSLGNFCFDWPGFRNSPWNNGMLLRLVFNESGSITSEYKLISQNEEVPDLVFLEGDAQNELMSELERLNSIIQDDQQLAEHFSRHCDELVPIMLSRIQPYRNKLLVGLHKRGFLPDIMGPGKRKMLAILAQCESHREVFLNVLKRNLN